MKVVTFEVLFPSAEINAFVRNRDGDFNPLADWAEAYVLFGEEPLSHTDVADWLASGIQLEKTKATEEGIRTISELAAREKRLGATSPFTVADRIAMPAKTWKDFPAYTFCLVLAMAEHYPGWKKSLGSNYNEQGALFERLTEESMKSWGWTVQSTGWKSTDPALLREKVPLLCGWLTEKEGDLSLWTTDSQKDGELDLVSYREFPDGWRGRPIYLVQCASGGNWDLKLKTPDLDLWRKLILFTTTPLRAFSTPFAFNELSFIRRCAKVDGLFLDRHRLISTHNGPAWQASSGLSADLVKWLETRIPKLPRET